MHNSKKEKRNSAAHTFMRSQANLKKLSWGKLDWFIIRASISPYQQSHVTGRHTEESFAISILKCSSLKSWGGTAENGSEDIRWKSFPLALKLQHLYLTESLHDSVLWSLTATDMSMIKPRGFYDCFLSSLNSRCKWVTIDLIISCVSGESKMKRQTLFTITVTLMYLYNSHFCWTSPKEQQIVPFHSQRYEVQ